VAEFMKVADLSEVQPGQGKAIEAGGKSIALFNVDGTIYALDNTCLHQGGPLGDGDLIDDVVTCPWHGWTYNVRTGEKCDDSSIRVSCYPVKVDGEAIMVEL
jgi:nitrite reductase (NADH) small subunit